MQHTIRFLVLMICLNSSLFAKLTSEEVNNYLSSSRGGTLLAHTYTLLYREFFSIIYDVDMTHADETTIKKYRNFFFDPKYENMSIQILSNLNPTVYDEIMYFYKTKLGQKYKNVFKKFNLYTEANQEFLDYYKQYKQNANTRYRAAIIKNIDKELNLISLKLRFSKTLDTINSNQGFKYNYVRTVEEIDVANQKYKSKLKKELSSQHEFVFKDFSNEELLQILEYARAYGHIEMKFIYESLTLVIEQLIKDIHLKINNGRDYPDPKIKEVKTQGVSQPTLK